MVYKNFAMAPSVGIVRFLRRLASLTVRIEIYEKAGTGGRCNTSEILLSRNWVTIMEAQPAVFDAVLDMY